MKYLMIFNFTSMGRRKDKHSYFVDLMKMHDKDLVGDKCQSGFQPI